LNVLIDTVAGIIPVLGDVLDNLFKSNLRNLALLETWLLTDPYAGRYHILLMPESDDFIPTAKSRWTGWFKGNHVDLDEQEARRRERASGKVRKTRRMTKEEGEVIPQEPLD
jgi:hypothetical protein